MTKRNLHTADAALLRDSPSALPMFLSFPMNLWPALLQLHRPRWCNCSGQPCRACLWAPSQGTKMGFA